MVFKIILTRIAKAEHSRDGLRPRQPVREEEWEDSEDVFGTCSLGCMGSAVYSFQMMVGQVRGMALGWTVMKVFRGNGGALEITKARAA
jgi:VanZ family protein